MRRYIIKRLLLVIPTLIGVSVLIFLLVRLMPGDPVSMYVGVEQSSDQQIAIVKQELGLDKPMPIQYLYYVKRLAMGDMGRSFGSKLPVAEVIFERLPATMELGFTALIIALLIAIPVGVVSAVRRYSWVDNTAMTGALLGISLPTFWVGLLLILLFALQLGLTPASGRGTPVPQALAGLLTGDVAGFTNMFKHMILPAVTLSTALMGLVTRLVRSSMLEVMHADYVRTARSKGLKERNVIFRHALRNAMIPVITVIGLQIGGILSGSVITETVFAWPGVGRMVVTAVLQRDYPVVQGVTLVFTVVFIAVNLVVDLGYAFVDPRIRYD
ncbi:MAG: Dipeptide transport system permease protein DppB [Firmicutes bacterium]|nr:Dipeptide transport system permease protein DppB [Bacillota bacterium]